MPKNNETTTKFNADISDLKKGIQEANRQIRLANSEFKAAAAGADDWSKNTDVLSKKIDSLNKVVDAQKSKLSDLEKQHALVVKEQGENSKGAQELEIKINNQKAAVARAEAELKSYEQKLADVKKEQKNSSSAYDTLNDSIEEQQTKLTQLKDKYKNVVLEQGKNSKEAKELGKQIKQLSGELSDNKSKMADAAKAADDLDDSLDDAGKSADDASGGFTIMKGALADLVAKGIEKAVEAFQDLIVASSEASASFQAQTGATSEEMKQFNKEMTEIYKNNYGESLQDIADKMAYVKQATGEVDPSKLKELTENAIALEDTFGSDFNETIRGVKNLMEQFGIDAQTAFDLFAKGSQEGLDYTDELGDNVAEYAGNFKQAGYSAEEYFQLLANGTEGGAYNLDKVNDSINEIKNRLGDGTIGDAIGSFSKDTQTAFKNWQDGKGTMKDVIDSIVSDISNCTNEQEALTMAATAFGTMGEDANLDFVKSLTTVGDEFTNVKGKMDEVKDTKYSDVGNQFAEIGRLIKTELIQPLVDTAMPVIQDFAQFIIDNFPTIAPIITGIATAFGVLAAALGIQALINGVQKAFALLNLTMLANPIVLIVAAIAGLVVAFVTLWNKSEAFRNFWINLWDGIKNACGAAKDWIGEKIEAMGKFFTETLPGFFTGVIDWVKSNWSTILTFLTNPFAGLFKYFYENNSKFKEFVDNAVKQIKQLPGKIWTWLTTTITKINVFFKAIISAAKVKAKAFIDNIISFIKQLPGKVWSFLTAVINKVTTWGKNMASKALNAGRTFLTNVVKFITQLPGKIASHLSKVISNLATWASNMGKKGKEAAKKLLDNVVNGVKSLPKKVLSIGKNIVTGLWNGITSKFDWLTGKIKGFATNVTDKLKSFFGIHSPSRVMRDQVGKYITLGIVEGIVSEEKTLAKSMKSVVNTAVKGMKKAIKNSKPETVGNEMIKSINKGVSSAKKSATNTVQKLVNNMVNSMKKSKLYDKYKKAGQNVVKSFSDAYEKECDRQATKVTNAISKLAEKAQKKYDEIISKRDDMQSKMQDYGDLYTKDDDGNIQLANIKQQTKDIKKYSSNLTTLKGKVSKSLMEEISSMGIEEGLEFTNKLLSLSNEQLAEYDKAYTAKMKASKKLSKAFYADQLKSIKTEFTDKVKEKMKELKKSMGDAGKNAAKEFTKNLNNSNVAKEAKTFAKTIVSNVQKELGISTSTKKKTTNSSKKAATNSASLATKKVKTSAAALKNTNTATTKRTTVNNNYNFVQNNTSPKALRRLEIYRQTKNQLVFAKGV